MATKKSYHIILIPILIIAFFIILFVSTSTRSVTENYDVIDTIYINYTSDFSNMKVGEVQLINTGMFSTRVNLKAYVLCDFSGYFNDRTYDITYRGAKTESGFKEPFYYSYYNRKVDLSSKESIEFDLYTNIYLYNIENSIKKNNLYKKDIPLYLFEVSEDANYNSYYNYCDNVRAEDALKTINVIFNIDPNTLNNNSNISPSSLVD